MLNPSIYLCRTTGKIVGMELSTTEFVDTEWLSECNDNCKYCGTKVKENNNETVSVN